MAQDLLTICIPSFNRLPCAKQTLSRLFAIEAPLKFRVIVIDNASPDNYLEILSADDSLNKHLSTGKLIIERNKANIGMSGNILRCFEQETEGWLWILSDDDDVCEDALQKISSALKAQENSNYSCIYFGRYDGIAEEVSVHSLPEFIDLNSKTVNNFNQSIFLSNSLYRMSDVNKYISSGYLNAGTYIPHFMMIVSLLNDDLGVKYSNKQIVNFIRPEVGYSYSLVAGLGVGLPKHVSLNLTNEYYRRFLRLFYPHNDFKVIVDLYFETKETRPAFTYLVRYYLTYIKLVRPFYLFWAVWSFAKLAQSETVFTIILKVLGRISPRVKSEISEIKKRNCSN